MQSGQQARQKLNQLKTEGQEQLMKTLDDDASSTFILMQSKN